MDGIFEHSPFLKEEDIRQLSELERSLPDFADLTDNDVFIDCYDETGRTVIVASHARPRFGTSLYADKVVGKTVLKEMEPAVYKTLENGVPSRDLKAITQEGRTVEQDVIPVTGTNGEVISVLIREKDISDKLLRDKKYRKLSEMKDTENNGGAAYQNSRMHDLAIREAHHRIKNDLQMIASMINLQARNTSDKAVKEALHESAQRVLSIAAIQETLMSTGGTGNVHLLELLKHVSRNVQSISGEERRISVTVEGDDLMVSQDAGTSLAVVANELMSNAAMHAFREGEEGIIRVSVSEGNLYSDMTVEDNGSGFETEKSREGSLGFDIVRMTTEEKLHGKFVILSGKDGTKASVSFRAVFNTQNFS